MMSGRTKKYFLLLTALSLLVLIWTARLQLQPLIRSHLSHLIDLNPKEFSPVMVQSSKDEILSEEIRFMGNVPVFHDPLIPSYKTSDKFDWTRKLGIQYCGWRPRLLDMEISNQHWQVLRLEKDLNASLMFGYGAYVDTRETYPVIRILIDSEMHWNHTNPPAQKPNFCQIWYPSVPTPVITTVQSSVYVWFEKWGISGRHHPYLLTCLLPRKNNGTGPLGRDEVPESVSLVQSKCDAARNDLQVNYFMPKVKKDFGVCVKGLEMPRDDFSVRMVQWIEMLRILGAQGIHFHKFHVHPNLEKVLSYYERSWHVTVKPFTLPGFQPNLPVLRHEYLYSPSHLQHKRRQEVIAYNDCFLKYMHTYKYIAVIDIDEVILPVNVSSWKELVEGLESSQKQTTSYCFQMLLFVDSITKGDRTLATAPDLYKIEGAPYMMNKLHREVGTVCYGGGHRGSKCFHNTKNVVLVHNHFPRICLPEGTCFTLEPSTVAYTHHHKESCGKDVHEEMLQRSPFTFDPTIRFYKDQLIRNSNQALRNIGL